MRPECVHYSGDSASRGHKSTKPGSMEVPHLKDSGTAVITGAKSKGQEMLTLFALSDSARTGALIGDAYTISPQYSWHYRPTGTAEPFPLTSLPPPPSLAVANVFSLSPPQGLLQP